MFETHPLEEPLEEVLAHVAALETERSVVAQDGEALLAKLVPKSPTHFSPKELTRASVTEFTEHTVHWVGEALQWMEGWQLVGGQLSNSADWVWVSSRQAEDQSHIDLLVNTLKKLRHEAGEPSNSYVW